jgi:hypothetical protein
MSRLTEVLDNGAQAAEVVHGLWRVVVWRDVDIPRGGWHGRAVQPQHTDEDLQLEAELIESDLMAMVTRLSSYPYFVTPDLPWRPAKIPIAETL